MEIVLEVPDKDAAHVLELIKGIKRVKIKSPISARQAAKAHTLAELADGLRAVKRQERGEVELTSWEELYAELKAEQPAVPTPAPTSAGAPGPSKRRKAASAK